MKNLICFIMVALLLSCSRVTTQPDTQATTSGTMGSVKATTTPPALEDSMNVNDSGTAVGDSLNRKQ